MCIVPRWGLNVHLGVWGDTVLVYESILCTSTYYFASIFLLSCHYIILTTESSLMLHFFALISYRFPFARCITVDVASTRRPGIRPPDSKFIVCYSSEPILHCLPWHPHLSPARQNEENYRRHRTRRNMKHRSAASKNKSPPRFKTKLH